MAMITKKEFEKMRAEMEQHDELREKLIAESRKILKKSKAAIYSAHRSDIKQAEKLLKEAKQLIGKAEKISKKGNVGNSTGAFNDALEEYVEAACYVSYLQSRKIPTAKQLGVTVHTYLPGLSDLVGELVRKAVNSAAKGNYKTALEIKEDVETLYAELMLFNWRNSPARRKFDAIKYGLEKLEDLSLKIAFK